ncbi:MAG: saccharopine dehydrogenase NADP-binding domain-containing protein [Mycobacterium sp.]
MKVVAIGGAGAVGAAALATLTRSGSVDEVVVADRDAGAVQACARALGITGRIVDATDTSSLRAVLADADVVLNTVGPFQRFGSRVLQAAIDTQTHYVDVCDDWQPTLEMLALHDEAAAAGVTAVIGIGASPGVSNLMAKCAAAELDTIDELYTVWPVDPANLGASADEAVLLAANGRPSAAALHWMQQCSGTIAVARGGHLEYEAPLRPIRMRLPGGRVGTVYTVGHPEPVTLQRTLAASADIACAMVVKASTAAFLDRLRRRIDAGRDTLESSVAALVRPGWRSVSAALLRAPAWRGPGNLPAFFVSATGRRAGAATTVLVHSAGAVDELMTDMARATGVPLALTSIQICQGLLANPGVHAPESVIDPGRFFADLARQVGADPARPLAVEVE